MASGKKSEDRVQLCAMQDVDSSTFVMGLPDGYAGRAVAEQQPPSKAIFCESRQWATRQFYIREILKLRKGIYNFGFTITAASGKKADIALVDEWKKKNADVIADFNRDTWHEWVVMDNAVALWRAETKRPLILSTEAVNYSDKWAVEKLRITHGLSAEDIDRMRLSAAEAKELKDNAEIELVKQRDNYTKKSFFFECVKREKVGMGLAWPTLRSIFNPANGLEALQVGDLQLADTLRTVYEWHQVGHEVKGNSNLAGRSTHFLKEKRAEAIKKQIKRDKRFLSRLVQMIVNFDHKITYPRPDPSAFAASRYEGFMEQLVVWSMPLGQMIFAKGVNPFLMTLLKAQATEERSYIGPFLRRVLTKALNPPSDIAITFGDDVFWDSRLMLDVLKTGLSLGPLSQESWLTKTGFNPSLERAQKSDEAKLPRDQVVPLFDASHGDQPPGNGKGNVLKKPGPKNGSKNVKK